MQTTLEMEIKTDELIEIIKQYSDYKVTEPLGTLPDFAAWLLVRPNEIMPAEDQQLNRDIGHYLNRINRYSRHYVRLSLQALPIKTLDEFTFMAVIQARQSPSKSEVYEATLTELTTGTQLLKRLISLGLVEEADDESDRRVKRVQLTPTGQLVYQKAFDQIGKECDLKVTPLSREERETLHRLLMRLEQFHGRISSGEQTDSVYALLRFGQATPDLIL